MAKNHSTGEAPRTGIEALSELLQNVQNELYDLRAMVAASKALIFSSEHGESDEELGSAIRLHRLFDKKALKLINATDSVNVARLVKGGAA